MFLAICVNLEAAVHGNYKCRYPLAIMLYTKTEFKWQPKTIGLYGMLDDLFRGFGMLVALPIASMIATRLAPRRVHLQDRGFLVLSIFMTIGQYIG
jgi:hypothetical protein